MLLVMRPRTLRAASLADVALFSDVDGTLLDASDRLAISAAMVAGFSSNIELILASSRTLAELAVIQRRLGVSGPMIAENGAVVSFPARWRGMATTRREVVILGDRAVSLVPRIHRCAAQAGVRVVNQKHFLPDRGRSIRRGYSVCLANWTGKSADTFFNCLTSCGLVGTRSGRWITITSGPDKGSGVRAVLDRAREIGAPYRSTIAIGNAANDAPLFEAVDTRLAVKNRSGHDPELRDIPGVHLLSSSGTRAWKEALEVILPTGT